MILAEYFFYNIKSYERLQNVFLTQDKLSQAILQFKGK